MKSYQVADVRVHGVEGIEDVTKISLQRGFLLGLDCETNGTNAFAPSFRLRTVQIATETDAYVFRMDEPWQVNYVESILADDTTSFVSYTDADVMFVWGGLSVDISHRNLDDHMLAVMAAPDDRLGGMDLKTVHVKYCKVSWLKDAQAKLEERFKEIYAQAFPDIKRPLSADVSAYGWSNIPVDDPVYVTYGGLDAVAARRLAPILIKTSGAPFSLIKMETWLSAEAARMRMRGMHVDQAARDLLYNEKKAACDYHEEKFGEIVWEPIVRGRHPNKYIIEKPISPRSGKKVARYLHDCGADFTGFPLTEKGQELLKEDMLSVEDEVTGKYASLGKKNKELVEKLNVSQEAEVAIEHLFGFKESIYFTTKIEEVDKVIQNGVFHPVLRTTGTVTGRMSSSSPNVQNWPKKDPSLREIVVPPPGYVFIGCDYPQIEIRVGAGLAQCPVLMEVLYEGRDIHQETADATGVDRQTAKIVNFLCQYNGGPKALKVQTGIDIARGKQIVELYWRKYYGMDAYRKYASRFSPEIRNIANRRIPVPFDWTKREYRTYVSMNYFTQSAARELIATSWWRFVNDPASEGCFVAAVIHDEIVIAAPVDRIGKAIACLENSMSFQFMGVEVKSDAIVLADAYGKSFWTTGDAAVKYREERKKNGTLIQGLY